jgi:hypothetical protein
VEKEGQGKWKKGTETVSGEISRECKRGWRWGKRSMKIKKFSFSPTPLPEILYPPLV